MSDNSRWSKIIAIAGPAGAGKTTLAEALCRSLGAVPASFGDFVRAEARRRGLLQERTALEDLGQSLLKKYGAPGFTAHVLARSTNNTQATVVVDGVRHLEVWDALAAMAPAHLLVYLELPLSERQARVATRDRVTADSLERAMSSRMEVEATNLRQRADLVLHGVPVDTAVAEVLATLIERGMLPGS